MPDPEDPEEENGEEGGDDFIGGGGDGIAIGGDGEGAGGGIPWPPPEDLLEGEDYTCKCKVESGE